MNRRHFGQLLFFVFVMGMLVALTPEAAWAAPGGIVKAASRTLLGKIVFGIVVFVLLPWVIYFFVRRAIQIRRTRADLERLAKRHPQYRWLDVKDRATQTFNWVWSAWSRQKMDLASDFTTHWYWQNQQLQLEEWERQGLENVCRLIKIQDIVPLFVQHVEENDGEGSRVVVDITAKVVDYLRDRNTGRIVQGDDKEGDLDTVWTFRWENGAWRLNLIEDGAEEWNYLLMPNEVPAPAAAPQAA